ncbi:MAG TPA: ACT domain-containing protein, partial [Candidatus Melainabacteria bacterium]|nr:ACT domain-containing protein [Candidatus Melainabacteria bacterium]
MPEKNLSVLLSSIKPRLHDERYVFCSVLEREFKKLTISPICMFREDEGVSLIVEQSDADASSLKYDGTWAMITCEVHSDLNAVGFIAAMAKMIADAGISVNTVSAYHHDHLFVPSERADEVMLLLQEPP